MPMNTIGANDERGLAHPTFSALRDEALFCRPCTFQSEFQGLQWPAGRAAFLKAAGSARSSCRVHRICCTSVRGHYKAVVSHDKKVAAVLTALRKELLFPVAVF